MTERLLRLEFRAVGTTCSAAVTAGVGDALRAGRALAATRAEVEECEAALSRFRPESDLSRLNAADGEWLSVDRRLVEALRLAVRAREDTEGRFDPTVLPALVAAGYDKSFEQLDERAPRPADDWRAGAAIEVEEGAGRARVERGAAVDLGGDLALAGSTPEGGPWQIAIADPRRPGTTAGLLLLDGGGVATSGRDLRRFGPGGSLHHLIDPATGEPALPGPLAVTVVAATAAEAEAHATALAISTREDAAAHIAAHPALSALFIPADGEPVALGPLPLAEQKAA